MINRIDYDKKGNLDDVAIGNVDLFRLEYMADNSVWIKLIREGEKDITFWLTSEKKISGTHELD